MDLSRRAFTLAGATTLAQLSNPLQRQLDDQDGNTGFTPVAFLVGIEKPGREFFEDKAVGSYIFYHVTGAMEYASPPDYEWQPLKDAEMVYVTSRDDLPAATNGSHTLENKVYLFNGFVTSPYALDISNSPVLAGRHASTDGFIHTGGQTAIIGSGGGYFQTKLYVHAPGGTLYDISGDQSTEMLVTDSAFSDAAGIANLANLGVVTGFRVPTWKNCNFEDFNAGLVFDGTPDKIFIAQTPFRNISASGVDILTLAGTSDVALVDFTDNYIKDVQADTRVWHIEAGAEPSEVFQYRGTLHDTSFSRGNAITGPNASPSVEPFWVSESHPVRDSSVTGELFLTADKTVTINAIDDWYEVNGTTQLGNEAERTQQLNDGTIEYLGEKDVNVQVTVSTSFTGANGDIYEIAISKNGTVEPASTMEVEAGGQNAPVNPSTSAIEDLQTGDTISLQVRNREGTSDAEFRAYVINYMD